MTLKARNSILKVFFALSLACIAGLVACFISALVTDSIVPPTDLRLPEFLLFLPFAQYHFTATMISITVLTLYVPLSLLLIFRFFENTQLSEIIFFGGALGGFLCEGARFLIPVLGLWQSYSQLLFFVGRIIYIGRFAVPLFFFGAATMSDNDKRQDIERNVTIIAALSVVCAISMPLNSAQITTTGIIVCGFSGVFTAIRCFVCICTLISFYINAKRHDSPELKILTLYYAVLMAGYAALLIADNFLFLGLGIAGLGFGTMQTFRTLHKLYLWK